MKASPNELKSLFKQAFEACGYDFGRCEMAAESIVWAEMLGLNTFSFADHCMQTLNQDGSTLQVLLDEPQRLVIDNQRMGILFNAPEIVNLGIANALNGSGVCTVDIHSVDHPILMAKMLCDSRHLELAVSAYWFDVQTRQTVELKLDLNQKYPELIYYSQVHDLAPEALKIRFSSEPAVNSGDFLKSINTRITEPNIEQHLMPEYFAQRYQKTLNSGVHIDDELWRDLQKLGAQVLVESSEQSRQGAGS